VQIVTRDRAHVSMQLQADALVTPWLVVLRLRDTQGRTRHLPLLADMLPAEQFRRLRVRLRIEIPQLARGAA
jgi:hypothetical protein